jgi:methionyl-tRNA formyltransferase
MEGIIESRVNAIRLTKGVDEGPIYASSSITLQGTIEDVWATISLAAEKLIKKILIEKPEPVEQTTSKEIPYKRRKDNSIESNQIQSIQDLYRFIQMLDGECYPRAYIETENFKIEFDRASLREGSILCDAKITYNETK